MIFQKAKIFLYQHLNDKNLTIIKLFFHLFIFIYKKFQILLQ